MRTTLNDEHGTLVRYFLGELPPEERERVEERYMVDASYEELRDEVEMDLVDSYVCGQLTPQQRLHFERFYLITPERRQAVQASYLSRVYRERVAAPAPKPSCLPARIVFVPRRFLIPAAAAAMILLLAGGVFLLYRRTGPPLGNAAQSPAPIAQPSAPERVAPERQSTPPPLLAEGHSASTKPKTAPTPETHSGTTAVSVPPSTTGPSVGPATGSLDANRPSGPATSKKPPTPETNSGTTAVAEPPAQTPAPVQPSSPPAVSALDPKGPPAPVSSEKPPAPERDSRTAAVSEPPAQPLPAIEPDSGPVNTALDWNEVKPQVREVFKNDVDLAKGFQTLLARSLEKKRLRLPVMGVLSNRRSSVSPPGLSWKLTGFGALQIERPDGKKAYIAHVVLHCRITDPVTGRALFDGEVKGDSKRSADKADGLYERTRQSVDMASKDFNRTLIGDAIVNACDNVAAIMTGSPPPANRAVGIQIGASIDDIVAAHGNPKSIVNLGRKVIYVYADMKITFTDGKVSDVQ
jgi:hypothetical protein